MISQIAIIIPFLNEESSFEEMIIAITRQTLKPVEVIFVDAGSTDNSYTVLGSLIEKYQCLGFKVLRNTSGRLYLPGEARNIGVKSCNSNIVAFADMGTVPTSTWLFDQYNDSIFKEYGAVLGQCIFEPAGFVSSMVCALSAGVNIRHSTIPGTLITREKFLLVGYFPEALRAGEDLVWKSSFVEQIGDFRAGNGILRYNSFSESISKNVKKWFTYATQVALAGLNKKHRVAYVFFFSFLVFAFVYNLCFWTLLMIYFIARGVLDPIRRSKNIFWFSPRFGAFLVAPLMALLLDLAKVLGFINGQLKGLISESR
ncbi:MAG: hypothetical protein CME71_12785 [Halobacteriovorax sp.]|nr:hypothetical protein [Halobacteriovorax sp.]